MMTGMSFDAALFIACLVCCLHDFRFCVIRVCIFTDSFFSFFLAWYVYVVDTNCFFLTMFSFFPPPRILALTV